MKDFCEENPNHDKCRCFNAVDENGNEVPQPQCFYSPCANTDAYKLSSWSNIPCGSYCQQVIDIGGSTNTVIDSVNFTQYCGDDATTPGSSTIDLPFGYGDPNGILSLPESYGKDDLIEWGKNNSVIILSSVVLIFIIFAFIVLFLFA